MKKLTAKDLLEEVRFIKDIFQDPFGERVSSKAPLYYQLQGLWLGLQEAKKNPKVQKENPRGFDWFEKFIISLGKSSKNSRFKLSKKQVKKLNEFIHVHTSGELGKILRKSVVQYCRKKQCEIVDPYRFRFHYIEDMHSSGAVLKTLEQAKKEFYKSQEGKKKYRDDHLFYWQEDPNQSLQEFKDETNEKLRGLPGRVNYYYDPKEKKHFAFAIYNTF